MNGMEILFQGFGAKSPYSHHKFHHKRHCVQWCYPLSQQFTQDFIELPWFDACLWYYVRLDKKYLYDFSRFWYPMTLFYTNIGHQVPWHPP